MLNNPLNQLDPRDCDKLVRCLEGTSYDFQAALDDTFPKQQYNEAEMHADVINHINNKLFWCNECGCWYDRARLGNGSINDTCLDCDDSE